MKSSTQVLFLASFLLVQTTSAANFGTASIFYTGETVPKHQTKIEFQFPHCPLSSQLLDIKSRESMAKLKDQDTGKDVDVRYVYLIGTMDHGIQKCPTKLQKTSLKYQIPADPNRMTHFFVSVESPARIVSVYNSEQ